MASRPDLDDDDDFSEIYKAYTGPLGSSANNVQEKEKTDKRSPSQSDEDVEYDPNAVPTDFTSREAKVWEAKSKATERNWKKRKEEEMICKICGESGHFTQGCPTTLGGRRQDFFERVAARDKNVRALFTEKVIEKIEKDIGCKIKMDEKFIIVSGKDRLVLRKGVDAVHAVIKGECNDRSSPERSHLGRSRSPERNHMGRSRSPERNYMGRSRSPERIHIERSRSPERRHMGRSRSPDPSPRGSRFSRSASQKFNPSPRNASLFLQRFGKQDRGVEDHVRGDLLKPSRNSPQARAFGNNGGRGRASHSRSPAHVAPNTNSYNAAYEAHRQNLGPHRSDGWQTQRRDALAETKFEDLSFVQTLEDLGSEYNREAMNIARLRNQQEDEENYKHREVIRDMREAHMKNLVDLRALHAKRWEEFLQMEMQQRQQQIHEPQMSAVGGYQQQSTITNFDSLAAQPYGVGGSNFNNMDPRGQYSNANENYPHARPHETYNEFERPRMDGYGRAYNRY